MKENKLIKMSYITELENIYICDIILTTSFLYLTKRVSVDMIAGVLNLDEIMIQEFIE